MMHYYLCLLCTFLLHSTTSGFVRQFHNVKYIKPVYDVPLELTGQLDPSKKWDVKFIYKGEEKVVSVSEDCSFLEMGEKIFDGVESSCRNGICTTCAGQVVQGRDNVKLAVHGLGKEQIEQGFLCACQAYCTGPNVVVKLGMNEEVYEQQYGQYEKSYEMKFGERKEEAKSKKGWFG